MPPDLNINPSRPDLGQREKNNLNFYFHPSLWCLKRFYEGLKGLHKTFCDTTKKCENAHFNTTEMKCTGRERAQRRMWLVKQSELNNKIKNTCLRGLNCKCKEKNEIF